MGKRCPGERDHRETGPSSGQWVETRTERRRTATIKARERERERIVSTRRQSRRKENDRRKGKKKKAERKIRSDRKKKDRQTERERERERERRDEEREKRRESGESDQCRSSDIRKRIEEDTKYDDDDECKQTGMGKKETMRMIPHEDHELPLVSTSIIYVLVTITTTYCP